MYDSVANDVTTALETAQPTQFTTALVSDILALASGGANGTDVTINTIRPNTNGVTTVSGSMGAEVVFFEQTTNTANIQLNNANLPTVIFQGRGGVNVTVNDNVTTPGADQTKVDRVIVGSAGNDKIVVQDAKNTKIVLGGGDSSVTAGGGVDTVVAGLGNSTITGGTGDYTVVKLGGAASNYTVTTAQNNSHAVIRDVTTGKVTDVTKVQYVQLDNGNALIFAKSSVEAQVANLYHTAFGRTADAGGLDYWFDIARAGGSLKQISTSFVNSTEFTSLHSNETQTEFVQSLYHNTFNRVGEDAGVAFWLAELAGGKTKADLVLSFAELAIQNIQHTAGNQEAEVVGSINIIGNII